MIKRETFHQRFARTDKLAEIGELAYFDNKFYIIVNFPKSLALLNGVEQGGLTLDIDYFYENCKTCTEQEYVLYGQRDADSSVR